MASLFLYHSGHRGKTDQSRHQEEHKRKDFADSSDLLCIILHLAVVLYYIVPGVQIPFRLFQICQLCLCISDLLFTVCDLRFCVFLTFQIICFSLFQFFSGIRQLLLLARKLIFCFLKLGSA